MRTLLLLRHAKSDWDADFGHDHDRPLAPRGRKAAKRVGKWLAEVGLIPQKVVSSSAERAARTIDLAAKAGGWRDAGCVVEVTESLYEASPAQVLAVVHEQPPAVQVLLLAGHEPTWSDLASRLIGGGRLRVPTAALVGIGFEVDSWAQVHEGEGTLLWLLPPRLLEAGEVGE